MRELNCYPNNNIDYINYNNNIMPIEQNQEIINCQKKRNLIFQIYSNC